MNPLQERDVPNGDDWDSATNVAASAEAADRTRPWRSQIRDRIVICIAELPQSARGSGTGFGTGVPRSNRSSNDAPISPATPSRTSPNTCWR